MTATFALSVLAMPTDPNINTVRLLPRGAEGEPFLCPDPDGAAARKQALQSAGAQQVGTYFPPPRETKHPSEPPSFAPLIYPTAN